jgi:hypothetical protein
MATFNGFDARRTKAVRFRSARMSSMQQKFRRIPSEASQQAGIGRIAAARHETC